MYIHHSVPKSLVRSSDFVQSRLHKADSVYTAGRSRGSALGLFIGFLLNSSVYHTFIFYYFSPHQQQLWWSRTLHHPLRGTGNLLYFPPKPARYQCPWTTASCWSNHLSLLRSSVNYYIWFQKRSVYHNMHWSPPALRTASTYWR